MTDPRVTVAQTTRPPKGVQMVRCTIASVTPLTVTLPGGATVPAVKVAGLTYTANAAAFVLMQEPAIGPVFPIA